MGRHFFVRNVTLAVSSWWARCAKRTSGKERRVASRSRDATARLRGFKTMVPLGDDRLCLVTPEGALLFPKGDMHPPAFQNKLGLKLDHTRCC